MNEAPTLIYMQTKSETAKWLVSAAIRKTLHERICTIYKAAQTRTTGNGGEAGSTSPDESADLMELGWITTGRPTAPPPGAVGPFRHWACGVAWACRSPWPSG